MSEEKDVMNCGERSEDGVFRIEPPLCGVPVITFILMLICSAGTAVLAHGGPYEGWLWLVLSAGLVAYADFISGSRLPLLAPVVGAAISAVMFYPCIPMWSVAAAPLGYFISAAARGRLSRNTAFVLSSAALIIFAGLHFGVLSALEGDISFSGMTAQAVAPYTQMKELILDSADMFTENGIYTDPTVLIESMKSVLLRSAPATVVVCALLFSWLSTAVMNLLSRFFTPDKFICGKRITMSVTAAIVFVATYLIVLLFGSSEGSVIVLASENLSVMLMPGFFIVGITELTAVIKKKMNGIPFVFYILAVITLMLMSAGGVAVLYAAYGVFHILRTRYLERRIDRDGEL